MARDFLSNQIKTKKIIGSGNSSGPKLIVYTSDDSSGNSGEISSELTQRLSVLPPSTKIYIDGVPGSKAVTFGGDVYVSGTLWPLNNLSSMWEADANDANNLMPTNIIDGDTGLFALDTSADTDDGIVSYSRYTTSNRSFALDLHFEVDPNDPNSVMPKI